MKAERKNRPEVKLPLIRASEVGAYVYCRRAWWFRRVGGFKPQNLERRFKQGVKAHQRHSRKLGRAGLQERLALYCLAGSFVFLLLGLALLLFVH